MPLPTTKHQEVKRSEVDSKPNLRLIGLLFGCLVVAVVAGSIVWNWSASADEPNAALIAYMEQEQPTDVPTVAVIGAPSRLESPTPAETVTPIVIYEYVELVVTATPSPTPQPTPTPYYVYITNEVEVTRVVEVPQVQYIEPTPIVVPLGQAAICVHTQGVREIYVDGVGIAGGACRLVAIPATDNSIVVQVKRN